MICPKCGRPVDTNAVICSGCDFILDTEFLGEEILDEEQSLRPGMGGVDPAVFNLADAVILGDIDEQAQSFETSDSGFHVKESTNARLYVSGRSQAMMAPDAVPAIIEQNLSSVRLTPFEKHVLSFIDGKRPVEIIRVKAGLDESEVKTALATMADKGVVHVVGRALVDSDSFDETAQRRARPARRPSAAVAGAVAALGPLGDATDRAIEEAFRTATGLSPLGAEELAPPPDDDNVFSSLSGDPLVSALDDDGSMELPHEPSSLGSRGVSGRGLSGSGLSDSGEAGDTAYTQRPDDADLPSDADSFDLLAHTSEIERSPELDEVRKAPFRAAKPGTARPAAASRAAKPSAPPSQVHARGGLEPMATNARRVLSDPELAEILGSDDESELPGPSTRASERPSGLGSSGFSDASDGFDDFGGVSELNTAMLPGVDSSLSQGAPDSEVFKSVTGTAATPAVARPNRAAMANLQGRQHSLASESSEASETGLRPQLSPGGGLSDLLSDDGPAAGLASNTPAARGVDSSSDEDLDPDLQIDLGPSSAELDYDDGRPAGAAPLAPAPAGAVVAKQLGDGGDLADLVGDDPLSLEGTDTSKIGSAVDQRAADVHSVVTAAPLRLGGVADSEGDDPFAGLDLEESDEDVAVVASSAIGSDVDDDDLDLSDEGLEPTAAQLPQRQRSSPPDRRLVPVPSEDMASSSEGTAAFAENPFGPDAFANERKPARIAEDEDDAPTSTRPTLGEEDEQHPSSEVSAVFEVASEDEMFEGATDGVPALERAAAGGPSSGGLADAFSDEEADLSDDAVDPRNRPPQLAASDLSDPSLAALSAAAPAALVAGRSERSFSSDEELIDDAMIIRPAAANMPVRGASILERVAPRASPASAEVSSAHEEVEVSEPANPLPDPSSRAPAAPSSQETAHLQRPAEAAALSLAAPQSRSEETALFSGAGAAVSSVSSSSRSEGPESELSQGNAWASGPAGPVERPADGESSDSTHVLSAPSPRAQPRAPSSEASDALSNDDDNPYQPQATGSRNDPEAMREKARKLFEDALKDFREGRIGAARMNAKLATIYDPSNEEYRTALEQWGKGARRRAQQAANYVVLYDEAQEREGAGDVEGAITLLLQGAEQFPEIAAIQNRLGVLLAIHKREYDRASAYIQRAIELDPENLHYKSNLGKILSRRRERQKRANG